MTEQELIDLGYKPEECRVGTLYFRIPFSVSLKENEASLYTTDEDLLGVAKTVEELKCLEGKYYFNKLYEHHMIMAMLYGHIVDNYPEMKSEANGVFKPELDAFNEVNENWYDTNFDPSVDRSKLFIDTFSEKLYKSDIIGKIYRDNAEEQNLSR